MPFRLRHGMPRELHVAVDGAGLVTLRFPGSPIVPAPATATWVEVTIKHEVNAPIAEDMWRLYEAYEVERRGDTFNRLHGGSPICIAGDWECAIFESGEADFMGGLHGDETVGAASLSVDGTTRSLAVAWSGWAARATFTHTSTLYQPGTANERVKRGMVIEFTRTGFTVSQRLLWAAGMSLDYAYLGMTPVVRTIGAEQITHTAQRSPAYADEDVSVAGFVESFSTNANIVRVFGDTIWTETELTQREQWDDGTYNLPLAIGVKRWEKVSNAAAYNKVYFSVIGKGAAEPENVLINDVIWTMTKYTIRTDGGP